MSKPVLSAKRRQKGFESVRKGYRSANARPLIFEKEILYCKLTAASDIRKGLLHVSLGAVGSWSFCALKQGLINLGKFQKDLICFVRGCCLCVLIQALRNLEAPCKGDVFRTSEKNKSVHPRRELRGSTNLDSAHPNNNFAQTKLKPFLKGDSRFCKPRISPLKRQLRTNPIKSFAAPRAFSPPRLLETWSSCSRPFAILPVSAVSDAQKLATGNFLHVRAAFPAAKPPFCVACGNRPPPSAAFFVADATFFRLTAAFSYFL